MWIKWLMISFILGSGGGQMSLNPTFPSIKQEMNHQEKSIIVMIKKEKFTKFKSQLQKNYPNIKIKSEFHTVFTGLSLNGSISDLEKLSQNPSIISSHSIKNYQVTEENSVTFIGSEQVRGLFDTHNQRLTGKGIKVGVIDTGVDYSHPDLKQTYRGGYDVIDEDYEPMETTREQGEPTLHGTHVAGIIAANGNIKGVAPQAEIYAYRALGPGGAGTSESVILAIEKAIQDDVDIINLSLGNDVNGPDLPTSLALDRAVEKGIVTVTSSGNSGPGLWTVGSPGTAGKAISVGASVSPTTVQFLTIGFNKEKIMMAPVEGSRPWTFNQTLRVINEEDSKEQKHASGNVILLKAEGNAVQKKIKQAEQAGAKAVILYSPTEKSIVSKLKESVNIPVIWVSKKSGDTITQHIQSQQPYLRTGQQVVQDLLTSFSSRGPVTTTWGIKPDVVAPGYFINSTVPGGYERMHGTSMAAPHVAGACALILQAHPNWSPEQVKASLMNTSKVMQQLNGQTYRVYEQGAGRIQIAKAVTAESLFYPSSLSFGIFTRPSKKVLSFKIDNQSDKAKTYRLNVPKRDEGVNWDVPLPVTVPPRQTKEIAVTLSVQPRFKNKGIYDGYLEINDSRETFSLPYMYMISIPDYPRVMGLQVAAEKEKNTYSYELFLPEGADQLGVALFDKQSLQFVSYLDVDVDVERGMRKRKITIDESLVPGVYQIFAFVKKHRQEQVVHSTITIE
ncbi:S8 family serine peptidase [Priestia megaterium]|uniref:S8 family serine peptidase n=1 Tax=Priestia megaterium TaxID=1404 RepID=UPI00145588B6|nr:S8 family serine peptidase [Priestia megaterium]